MFTHGSRRVIIAADVTAWTRADVPSEAPLTSATRAQRRRMARSLAIEENWSALTARRNSIWPNASSTLSPAPVSARR